MLPAGWQAHNVEPLAYLSLEGPNAFKLTLKKTSGRWYLYVAQGPGPNAGFNIVDVTDPRRPVLMKTVIVPNGVGQITHHGNLLIVAQGGAMRAEVLAALRADVIPRPELFDSPFEGAAPTRDLATFFDISDPVDPKKLSTWNAPGWATHRNVYPGGKYAFMSAWVPGFKGQATLVILDVSDPTHPRQVGHWAQPGQADGEPDRPSPNGYHGPANISSDGKTLTLGYTPSLVTLDIQDITRPRLIGSLEFSPLAKVGAQAIHTVLPLGNGIVHVNTEPFAGGCGAESLPFAAIVDNREPKDPKLLSYYPRPVPPPGSGTASFCDLGGRFGPHNVNGETHLEEAEQPTSTVYMAYFIAGLRVYDVSTPTNPVEVGWFMPAGKYGSRLGGPKGMEEVFVDTRGIAYVTNGSEHGLWIVRYFGNRSR